MRDAFVSEALASVRQLDAVLSELTDDEITHVIELEEGSLRRNTILDKLYREARQRARSKFVRN